MASIISREPTVEEVVSLGMDPNDIILGEGGASILPDNPLVEEVFGSEKVCPPLGFTFPELPDLDKLGDIADDALEEVDKLVERVKGEAASAEDTLKEFAGKVTDEANKALIALEKAALELEKQVKEQAAAAWDELVDIMDDLEKAIKAVEAGVIDIGKLGMDVMELPAKLLEGAFAGFKDAIDCLKGEGGSAEASFNKTSPELKAGTKEGRGKDGTGEVITKTEESRVVPDETGEMVRKQEVVTKDDLAQYAADKRAMRQALAEKTGEPEKPDTIVQIPISDDWLVTDREEKEYSNYMKAVGHSISGTKFVTVLGRNLTAGEQIRYDAGLPPLFIWAVPFFYKLEPNMTIVDAQAAYDARLMKRIKRKTSGKYDDQMERIRQRRVAQWVEWYAKQGKALPESAHLPYGGGANPHSGWTKIGRWHEASYDVQGQSLNEPLPKQGEDPWSGEAKNPNLMRAPIWDAQGRSYHWVGTVGNLKLEEIRNVPKSIAEGEAPVEW